MRGWNEWLSYNNNMNKAESDEDDDKDGRNDLAAAVLAKNTSRAVVQKRQTFLTS